MTECTHTDRVDRVTPSAERCEVCLEIGDYRPNLLLIDSLNQIIFSSGRHGDRHQVEHYK